MKQSLSIDVPAAEGALNLAILNADISGSYEEFIEIFDAFYDDDVLASAEGAQSHSVRGKSAVRALISSFLVPVHVLAEIAGLSVSVTAKAISEDQSATKQSVWTISLTGITGKICTLAWTAARTWNDEGRVVSEVHSNVRRIGSVLEEEDLRFRDRAKER